MIILIAILLFLGVIFIVLGLTSSAQLRVKKLRLGNEKKLREKPRLYYLFSFFSPLSAIIITRFNLEEKIKNRLDAAHLKLNAKEFLNVKLFLMLLFCVLSVFLFKKANPPIIVVAIALGYILPDFWVSRIISNRKYSIVRLLPETIDLLGLCVEGGLDFTSAVKWVVEKTTHNPLTEELSFILEEIKWGKSRIQALRDMSKRLNIPEVTSFVQTLVQAEKMGTPVTEAFMILSEDTRLQRFHRGERYAMQAPIKILFPLIFCILPVIAIIIGGPILLQFNQSGLWKGLGGG